MFFKWLKKNINTKNTSSNYTRDVNTENNNKKNQKQIEAEEFYKDMERGFLDDEF